MNLDRKTPENNQPIKQRLGLLTWLILFALIIWNVISFLPSQNVVVNLPYSTFLGQVSSDNVASVQITGSEIKGIFVQPYLWSSQMVETPLAQATLTASPSPSTPIPTAEMTPIAYTEFQTTFPEVVGDPDLMRMLEAHHVQVNVALPPSPWFTTLLIDGLPILLLIGFFAWSARRGMQGQSGIFSFGRSKARRYKSEGPGVTFADVAGADEAKAQLEQVVDFLRNPQKYHKVGARIPHGVLLVGPPGTGKTLISRAVAGEAEVPFFSLSASEFVEMFVGVGASRVRDLFKQATETAPAIVFIDELDAVGRRRGAGMGTVNDEREQTLNQLLVEMDGFDELHEIIVLAATNRPDVLDPALLRPGRFDRQLTLGLPDRPGREGILRIHTKPLQLDKEVDFDVLARATPGFSGADLANLCNEAALKAAQENHHKVTMSDFESAQEKILLGEARSLLMDESERRVIAYHESGHTLVAWLTPTADPVHKVTIIPHGRGLGVTEQLPGKDQYNFSRAYLLAKVSVMLGGRTAEELALGEITTGAENDLIEATRLVYNMVTRWGMGDLGPVAFQSHEEQPFLGYELTQRRDYSEATAAQIDKEVQSILGECHETTHNLLKSARSKLDLLANALMKEETLKEEELTKILGPRPENNVVVNNNKDET